MIETSRIIAALHNLSDEQLKQLNEKLIKNHTPRPRVLADELKNRIVNAVGWFTLCGDSLCNGFLVALAETMTYEQLNRFFNWRFDGPFSEQLELKKPPIHELKVND